MNADIRISVGFPNHPKTVKLDRRLGFQGIRSLRALWTWAAQNRPDGNLGGANVVSGVRSNEGSTAAQRREPDVGSTRALFVGATHRRTVVRRSFNDRWTRRTSRSPCSGRVNRACSWRRSSPSAGWIERNAVTCSTSGNSTTLGWPPRRTRATRPGFRGWRKPTRTSSSACASVQEISAEEFARLKVGCSPDNRSTGVEEAFGSPAHVVINNQLILFGFTL